MREQGLLTLSENEWAQAKRRADVVGPLSRMPSVGRIVADDAAAKLGISRRHLYELIRRYKAGSGLVTDVAPKRSSGGKGQTRLLPEIEKIIIEAVDEFYLSKQRFSEAALVREIAKQCRRVGCRTPARNTIRRRIDSLDPRAVTMRRYGPDQARSLQSANGTTPRPPAPLNVVQIDHTKVDLIVVDELSRQPIGRPSLTLAIDVFTRCILGMLLTFEAPSATSVGLCLSHIVTDKRVWLENRGLVDVVWPMHGKPGTICSDNAPEFKSEALRRGCEQHGITLEYRPQGQPHFGGIIERVIGTAMTMIHELPGTTFSNPQKRGSYDSEANAVLTLRELEKWLALAICTYHETVHGTLWESPIALWRRTIQHEQIVAVSDAQAFLIDFLPVIRRRIGRVGFVIDHIVYYADSLKPWIADRKRLNKFLIRRDPRDLSRVWVLDPASNQYLQLPYRTCSNPGVTLWEHRRAVEDLKKHGHDQVDEAAIFRMIQQMRAIADTAGKQSKRARSDRARRSHLTTECTSRLLRPPCEPPSSEKSVKPFDDIEEW